jgi:hypothetical protein
MFFKKIRYNEPRGGGILWCARTVKVHVASYVYQNRTSWTDPTYEPDHELLRRETQELEGMESL